jgi:HAD superfamily hydrolase (TIGR01509 family)
MVKAVIFDVDGTLVDTVDMHAEAWKEAFAEFGKELDLEAVRSQIGKGADKLMPVFLSREELDEFGEELEDLRADIYSRSFLHRARAFPKVRELFEKLRDHGIRIALASSAPKEELETYIRVANIDDLINAATSADDAEESKPEPDIFAAALESLGDVDPEVCIVVGDTPYDAIAAGKLSLKFIGLLSGGFPEDSLTANGAIEIYRDPGDLLENYDTSIISGRQSMATAE